MFSKKILSVLKHIQTLYLHCKIYCDSSSNKIYRFYPLLFLSSNTVYFGEVLVAYCFFLRYAALAPLYYRGAAVAVVVYDITSPDSFSKAQYWVKVPLTLIEGLLFSVFFFTSFTIFCFHLGIILILFILYFYFNKIIYFALDHAKV